MTDLSPAAQAVLIQLRGGPADGQELVWKHGNYPPLQVPVRGAQGLTAATYVKDATKPNRYTFVSLEQLDD